MKPERDEVAALRALYRRASAQVDAAPDPSVRATVLAAAGRAVDAQPHDAAVPFGRRRWPVSMAALLVVSLMTGLVVQAMRDEPDRVLATAPAGPSAPPPAPPWAPSSAPVVAAPAAGPAVAKRATPERARPIVDRAGPRGSDARDLRPASPVAKPEQPRADSGHAVDDVPRDAASGASGASGAADAVAPAAKVAATPPPAPRQAPASASTPSVARTAIRPPSSAADEAAPAASSLSLVNTAQRSRRGAEPLTPEAWVERIVKLREAGDGAAADHEVEALHARYPAFEIPAKALGRP